MAGGRVRRRRLAAAGALLTILLIGIALRGWNSSGHAPVRPDSSTAETRPVSIPVRLQSAANDEFVGTETCGTCHTGIWRRYRESPMGRSLASPLAAVPQIERYDATEFAPPGPRRYRVEREGDVVRHHESLIDDEGHVLYDQAMTVSYALGSGKRGRAYLFEHDGLLFKSQIAWFTAGREWGLAPDYLPESHKRFERRITDGCITCHAGRVDADPVEPDKYGTPAVIEAAISCERCHGPGRRHVEAHEASANHQLADEFIVHPAKLDTRRQISVCAQCHLHGEARIMRTGQKACDFQPGQLLEDNRIVFVAQAQGDVSGRQALSQVEQMLASACYRGSEGRLGCTSCHDPHGNPTPETRVEFYRGKCLACHGDRGCSLPAEERLAQDTTDSCAACHMPTSLQLAGVLHVSFADHRVPRRAPPETGTPAEATPARGEIVIFDHADQRLPKLEIDRAGAFVLVGGAEHAPATPAGARVAEQLLLPIVQAQSHDVDALEVLGAACLMQRRPADAERYWLKALEVDPRRESVLRQLGTLYYEQRRMTLARDYLRRYLAVNSWHGSMHAKYAGALAALEDWPPAIQAAERALELNPSLATVHELLVYIYEKLGEPEKSRRHRELFERIQGLVPHAADRD